MKHKKIVEVQINDEQRMAIGFVRDLLENIIFGENQDVDLFKFNGSNYRMKYKELCDAAYILTKIVGVKPWEQI